MAIQSINLGTAPNGVGGDTLRSTATKINENFSNVNHAASKETGVDNNQIPLAQDTFKASFNKVIPIEDNRTISASLDFDDLDSGTRRIMRGDSKNAPIADSSLAWELITRQAYSGSAKIQVALGLGNDGTFVRSKGSGNYAAWVAITTNLSTYRTTTAQGANVVVDSSGKLQRSTSSERYKDIIAPLALDNESYTNAMQIQPIVYRSTAEADNPLYHYYSFSAEALGAYDKAFTFWRETETVTETKIDEDGNEYLDTKEVPLEVPLAEGLNINALLAFNHAISVKQDALIKSLEARIDALESKDTSNEV